MPYRSAKQRAFMHAQHPDIAARWDAETGGKIAKEGRKGDGRSKTGSAYHRRHKKGKHR